LAKNGPLIPYSTLNEAQLDEFGSFKVRGGFSSHSKSAEEAILSTKRSAVKQVARGNHRRLPCAILRGDVFLFASYLQANRRSKQETYQSEGKGPCRPVSGASWLRHRFPQTQRATEKYPELERDFLVARIVAYSLKPCPLQSMVT